MTFLTTIRPSLRRAAIAATLSATMLAPPAMSFAQSNPEPGAGTPPASEAPWSCDMTPGMGMSMSSTPMPADTGAMAHGEYPFDQLYIDMMMSHHNSVIALAQAAAPRLSDPRLVQMAQDIVTAQSAEIEQMTTWREAWYGSAEPDLSEHSMMAMLEAMPVGTMDEMMQEMDPLSQVAAFCSAADPDLAFIDLVIPHHQMAIDVSVIARDKAEHPEISQTADSVIASQQAEIDELSAIRSELTSDTATPSS